MLLLLAATALPADTLHVITLRNRPAAEIESAIRPLLRPDEALSATGYQLLLRASEARRQEIEKMVAALDVAPRQLMVTVRQAVERTDARRHNSISGDIDVGSRGRVSVGEGTGDRRRDGVRYRIERRESTVDNAQTHTVRVQDGQRAFIRVGQSVPVVERIVVMTGRGPTLAARGLTLHDFTTGFDVLPRVRGERVQLEITPRLSGPRSAEGLFQFQELQTTVTTKLGEWIDLGAMIGDASDVHRAILERSSSQSGERMSITLKVE